MKYLKLFILLLCSSFFFACEKKNNTIAEESNWTGNEQVTVGQERGEIEFPKCYNAVIDGVKFNMCIEVPENVNLNNLTKSEAVLQSPNQNNIVDVFMMERNVKEKLDIQENAVYVVFEDGATLYASKEFLNYSTQIFQKIHSAFRIEKTSLYNADVYSKDEEFDFMCPEDAFENVLENIKKAGYCVEETDYNYYALNSNIMKQEEREFDKEGEEITSNENNWSDSDNSYYFFARQIFQGLPVYYGTQNFPQDTEENRPIQALVSERGLERLDVFNLYTFCELDEKVKMIDFQNVVEKVAYKYGDILTDSQYEVKRATLYQVPVKKVSGDYDVKIAWLFEVYEGDIDKETGESVEYILYSIIDAETGEEIAI